MTSPNIASAEQLLAAGHWLLSATSTPRQARAAWADSGSAWLQPGAVFTAVIVRAGVMHGAVGRPGPLECAEDLTGALVGPVFYRAGEFGAEAGYTVLLPASAASIWRVRGTVVVSASAQLLVPAPNRLEPTPAAPWWVVPPDGPGALCAPALLASLLARGEAATSAGEGGHA